MRGRQLIAIAVTAVALNSCSRNHEQPMAPEPPLIVEFVADQPEFRGDENVMATLSNHSSVTVYFDYQCPAPPLEREVAGEWAIEGPRFAVACPAVGPSLEPSGTPISPGKTVRVGIPRNILYEDLNPGSYRFLASVSRTQVLDRSAEVFRTPPFLVLARNP